MTHFVTGLAVLLVACGAAQERIRREDADAGESDASSPVTDTKDAAVVTDASELTREARFWKTFEIDGDWAEFYPTIQEMAQGADAVLLAEVAAVKMGNVIQGDAQEDVVSEAVVTADVIEVVHGTTELRSVDFTLLLPRALTVVAARQAIADLEPALPVGPTLLLLRQREADLFRPVNGWAIWAKTLRAELDAPLNPYSPDEDTFSVELLGGITSFEELVDTVRP